MKTKLLLLSGVLVYSVAFSQNPSEAKRHDSVRVIQTDLKTFIPEYMQIQHIPGVSIALVNDNNIVWADGFGFSNSVTKKHISTNTRFEVASISKVVTAYIALRLVDEGKLSLDKPLLSYLSKEWMPYSVYQDSIKLNHALSHSSGLRKTTREILFKPGSAYYYSANGFNLVKDVMEEVSGENLEELAQRLVFQPLGMMNSSFARNNKLLPDTANGHMHATVPIVLFGIPFLVQYLFITLIGALIIRLSTKSWKLKPIHKTIFMILSAIMITVFLFLILEQDSLNEFAWLILFAGIFTLGLFLVLFYTGRKKLLKTGLKKVYQRIFNIVGGLLLCGIFVLVSTRVINLPVPKWPNYAPGAAGTLRTSPSELALFMIEIANPSHLKTETAELLRTPQIKLDENLSWGMGPGIFYSEKGYALWQWGQHVDIQSIMIIYPESKSGVVVCTNNDLLNPDVAFVIAQRALGENLDPIRSAIHLSYDYSK